MPIGFNKEPDNSGGCQNPLDAAVSGVKELRKELDELKAKVAEMQNAETLQKKPDYLPEHKAVNFETK